MFFYTSAYFAHAKFKCLHVANWLRSQLLVAVMAVSNSSSCSSLPAQDLEQEREMNIYIHDAASSLVVN